MTTSTMTTLKARALAKNLRRSTIEAAQSIRFDIDESPDYINEGKGWTHDKAVDFMRSFNIDCEIKESAGFLRAQIRPKAKFIGMHNIGIGVEIMLCDSTG